ncbi:MAG: hypothetical protein SFU57_12160 [Gemmatimonadales bacterium]|nr:hypothetical protein [Gemmatimonadales bacterium]
MGTRERSFRRWRRPGSYRVRLTVSADGGAATSEGWLRVVK